MIFNDLIFQIEVGCQVKRAGVYQTSRDNFISIAEFDLGDGRIRLLFTDFNSGIIRALSPAGENRYNAPLIRRHKNKQKIHRYNQPVSGEGIQIDTTKIAVVIYQYTAIDDCTRFRVFGIYSRHTAKNSVHL